MSGGSATLGDGKPRFAVAAVSQRVRKRVEEIFGWWKTIGGLARAWFIGRWKLQQQAEITAAAYNLLRLARRAPVV